MFVLKSIFNCFPLATRFLKILLQTNIVGWENFLSWKWTLLCCTFISELSKLRTKLMNQPQVVLSTLQIYWNTSKLHTCTIKLLKFRTCCMR
jgi:hypothetical protein